MSFVNWDSDLECKNVEVIKINNWIRYQLCHLFLFPVWKGNLFKISTLGCNGIKKKLLCGLFAKGDFFIYVFIHFENWKFRTCSKSSIVIFPIIIRNLTSDPYIPPPLFAKCLYILFEDIIFVCGWNSYFESMAFGHIVNWGGLVRFLRVNVIYSSRSREYQITPTHTHIHTKYCYYYISINQRCWENKKLVLEIRIVLNKTIKS